MNKKIIPGYRKRALLLGRVLNEQIKNTPRKEKALYATDYHEIPHNKRS
ncbi:hypothetical protein [Caldibacillus debilis]|jgi:hypothetical protein|nr:hypothetical protein [Caldibacillus debilis]